ncbi:MAG TPA: UDP-N-acetylmuramyl pentapeptide phosphotransferase [Thermoanaerobacterales bacterium]|nr:UDP-N-acetylmuramyl pentapeptide phosphotransferase [Thermoanaerobacterales bacterium]
MNNFLRWDGAIEKENYKNRRIKTAGGIVIVLSVLLISLTSLLWSYQDETLIIIISVACMGFVGFLDDIFGNSRAKGFKGHFKLLLKGDISTGVLKAFTGLATSAAIAFTNKNTSFFQLATDTFLIAFAINSLNILDLRPGRACKFFLFSMIMIAIYDILKGHENLYYHFIPIITSTIVFFYYDLKEYVMMGDTGSNVLGICFGLSMVWILPMEYKMIIAVFLFCLNLAAEKSSLSKIIQRFKLLRLIDNIGRRP